MSKFKKGKNQRRQSLTPEEKQLISIRAKRRFKAIVHLALANKFWLEDEDDEQLGDNVRKNVKLLTRKKGKKSLITLQEKSILSKAFEDRTEAEKFHLNRVIGGLKCFRRYPENVKSQLAAVTIFVYYPPDRVIIKQNDPPISLYFILTGEVIVSQTSWDPVLNEFVTIDVGTMIAGNMFGEVSLLHGIARTATIRTATHCELLCLKKNDFDVVLKASVQKQWEKIMSAMSHFTYFDEWDEVATRECCILARLRQYSPEETILGDGLGLPNYAYFVVSGKCRVVEHLYVNTKVINGEKCYSLFEEIEEVSLVESVDKKSRTSRASSTVSGMLSVKSKESSHRESESGVAQEQEESASSRRTSSPPKARKQSENIPHKIIVPPNVEVHFMQCCFLNETALFGIGENLEYRRIIAVTPVECLLIPKYWIFNRNKGNVWNKVAQFLNTHIPNRKQLFHEFLAQKKWATYRQSLVNDILSKSGAPNSNCIHNVPYSIRINEDLDFNYHRGKR